MGTDSQTKIKLTRWSYANFALSSFVVGGFMLLDPIGFWGIFGLRLVDPIVPTIYGGAVVGEGLACLWGWFEPGRASAVLLYMVAYKAVVVAALVPRLLVMEHAPWVGWVVVAAWGFVAIWAALLFPWRDAVDPRRSDRS